MSHVAQVLRIASTVACGIVIAAFVFWASDEGRAGSQQQVARLAESDGPSGAATTPAALPAGDVKHGGVRGAIEDANDKLLSPFAHVAHDSNDWAAHGFPALLALLTYGLLARMLIPYLVTVRR